MEIMLELLNKLKTNLLFLFEENLEHIFQLVAELFVNTELPRLEIYPPLIICLSNIVLCESFEPDENFWTEFYQNLLQYLEKLSNLEPMEYHDFIDQMIGAIAFGFYGFATRRYLPHSNLDFEKTILMDLVKFSRFILNFGVPSAQSFKSLFLMYGAYQKACSRQKNMLLNNRVNLKIIEGAHEYPELNNDVDRLIRAFQNT